MVYPDVLFVCGIKIKSVGFLQTLSNRISISVFLRFPLLKKSERFNKADEEDITLAWEEQDFLERIAELVTGDLSLHEAVDWIVVEEAERYSLDQWANIRSVTADAIRSNINAAREKLLAEEYREPNNESM